MDHSQAPSIDRGGQRFGGALFPFLIAFGASAALTIGISVSVRVISKIGGDARTPEQRASEETDRVLASITAGDSEATYKRFTRELRESVSELGWAKAIAEWKALGAVQSKEQKEYKDGSAGSKSWVEVSYQVAFANGTAKVSFMFLKASDGRWLIQDYKFLPDADAKAASKPE